MSVVVAAHIDEVLAQHLPDIGPLEAHTQHVVSRDLDQLLQTVRPWTLRLTRGLDFLPADLRKSPDKVHDSFAAQIRRIREDPVHTAYHIRRPGILSNIRMIRSTRRRSRRRPSSRDLHTLPSIPISHRRHRRLTPQHIRHLSLADPRTNKLKPIKLAHTRQNLPPALLQQVPLRIRHINQRPESLHMLRLHFRKIIQIRAAGQTRHESLPRILQVEETSDADREFLPFHAQPYRLQVLRLLRRTRQACQEAHPRDLKHGPNVLEAARRQVSALRSCARNLLLRPQHSLKQLLSPIRHLLTSLSIRLTAQVSSKGR